MRVQLAVGRVHRGREGGGEGGVGHELRWDHTHLTRFCEDGDQFLVNILKILFLVARQTKVSSLTYVVVAMRVVGL